MGVFIDRTGGIDLRAGNLNLEIKRDEKDLPLPWSFQDARKVRINGLYPVILKIGSVDFSAFSQKI